MLTEKDMINVYETTENSYYYLNSGENRDNSAVNVENQHIFVFYRYLSGHRDNPGLTGTSGH